MCAFNDCMRQNQKLLWMCFDRRLTAGYFMHVVTQLFLLFFAKNKFNQLNELFN